MADVFEALLGSAPPDERALIEGLRRRRAYGQLAAASGIAPLARVAGADVDRTQAEADAIVGRRAAQEKARAQAENQAEERKFRRWMQDEAGRQRGLDRALRAQLAAQAEMTRREGAADRDALTSAQREVRDRFIQGQTSQLASRLETHQLVPLDRAIRAAETVLNNPQYAGEIPGVGGIENIRALSIGPLATHIPVFGSGAEGRKVQATIAPLMNLILLARSGAAVTDPELQRMLVESGLTVASTDEDFRAGFARLKSLYEQSMQNMLAGYSPEVRRTYRRQGGLAGFAQLPDELALDAEDAAAELARRGVQ